MAVNSKAAIDAALAQNWEEAVKINKEILKKNKNDLDALSRLAFVYIQTCEFERAKKLYKKILSLDKFNNLALKNLGKIDSLHGSPKKLSHQRVSPGLFIEEPGKTKIVQLRNLAPGKIISRLNIGDTVTLHPKKHSVEIRGENKEYYGALPDDIAFRLIKFITAGNTYMACIKNIQKNSVSVFIREITRGKKLAHQPTFSSVAKKDYTPSIHRGLKKIVVTDNNQDNNSSQSDSDE